jgi:hypothetical protein
MRPYEKATPDAPTLVDYVLVALLNLGGDAGTVDIEDIAVEAMRLSPQRFRWRKYPYPSLEWVRVSLNNANNRGAQFVIRGSNRYERMLTAEGSRRARELAERLRATAPKRSSDEALRRRVNADLARLEGHPAFARWRASGWSDIDAVDLADMARCSPSTALVEFNQRLLRLEAEAAKWEREDLRRFLREAAQRVPDLLERAGVP